MEKGSRSGVETGRGLARRSLSQKKKQRREYSEAEVKDALEGALASGQDVVQMARQLFEECEGEEGGLCRAALFTHCIDLLNSEQLLSQNARELVGKLLVEVDGLTGTALVGVAEQLIEGVKRGIVEGGRSLELFPKVLSVISAQKSIRYEKETGAVGEMEGTDFKSHLLNSLCSCKWASNSVLHVTNMCRDITMSQEEMQFLIEKILRMMRPLSHSELPPLVYQLLVLSSRGHKSLVLDGIQKLFDELNREVLGGGGGGGGRRRGGRESEVEGDEIGVMTVGVGQRELLQTEGTVILHVTFALKQDQELGKEFLKTLKTMSTRLSASSLSLFSVSLALSMARIHRFQEPVLESLKAIILKGFKDEERKKASKWMQALSSDVCGESPDMESLMLQTVEHSKCGWDHVVEGIVLLTFSLMDSCSTKTIGSTQEQASSLGSKILFNTFKAHSMVQQEVVTQLINRILTNASSTIDHYISLLGEVVCVCPPVAMDSLPQLSEAFSYLTILPPPSAVCLLQAVLPLVQFSSAVRDSLLLSLRKSLFSRQLETRKIAVGGYLLLLKKFKVLGSLGVGSAGSQNSQSIMSMSSQVEVEVHESGGQAGYQGLCLELLGTLKRSLAQQCEVKRTLYQGLYTVLCSNPSLAESIIELLICQLLKYYEKEQDVTPPLRVEGCLATSGGNVHQTEPLDALLQCLQLCVSKYLHSRAEKEEVGEEVEPLSESSDEAVSVLQSLVQRMVECDMEDFELDRAADFSSSSVGQKNQSIARLVMGCYEVLLEYSFSVGEFSAESCELCLKLFHNFQKVSDTLSEKSGSSSGGKRGPAPSLATKRDSCNLSLQFMSTILHALFVDASPNHQQPLAVLRDSQAFVKYILNSCLICVHKLHTKGLRDGLLPPTQHRLFQTCCSLASPLYKQLEASSRNFAAGKKEKGKSVPVLCLEGFFQVLLIITSRCTDKLGQFLAHLSPGPAGEADTDTNKQAFTFIEHFQRHVDGTLSGCSRGWGMKDAQVMIGVISSLTSHLKSDSQELDKVHQWILSQCKEQNIDDNLVTKALVSLLLVVTNRQKGYVKILRKLALDIHYHLGDTDEDIELECRPHFAIVNPRTAAASVLGLVYAHIGQSLADFEWLIAKLKVEPVTGYFDEDEGAPVTTARAEELCCLVCDGMMYMVTACSELVQSAISPGTPTEGLLKVVTKLYTALSNLAKYYVGLYTSVQHIMPNFRKLVEMVGTHLSQQVYGLINYIQATQSLPAEQQDKKKGRKGKGRTQTSGKATSTVRREVSSFPSLIFAMEQFEKFLIQLSKKSKTNLMESFKRSTSRDFRINHQAIKAILNEDDEEMEEEGEKGDEKVDEGEEEEVEENGIPKAKKLKT